MVELMEAWFHADKDALERFYNDKKFRRNALKANPKVEQIPKKDIEEGLSNATKEVSKGPYYENKAAHAAGLLGTISPGLVRDAAPNCARLFEAILARLEESAAPEQGQH